MESKTQQILDYTSQLKLGGIREHWEQLVREAESQKLSYTEMSLMLLKSEADYRGKRVMEKRLKEANLPLKHNLDQYDYSFVNGLSKQQLCKLPQTSANLN